MSSLKPNTLSTLFKKLSEEYKKLSLSDSDLDNINLIAYSILEKIIAEKLHSPPINSVESINYHDLEDTRAIDYCLLRLINYPFPSAAPPSISPAHIATAMHLLNAAYKAYTNAKKREGSEGSESSLLFETHHFHTRWISAAAKSVRQEAKIFNMYKESALPFHPFFPTDTDKGGVGYIPTILRERFPSPQ